MRQAYEFANDLIMRSSEIAVREANKDGRGITEYTVEEVAYWCSPTYKMKYEDLLTELKAQIMFKNEADKNGWPILRKMNQYAKLDYLRGRGFEEALKDISKEGYEQPIPVRVIRRRLAERGFTWDKYHTYRDHLLSSGLVEPTGHGCYRIV